MGTQSGERVERAGWQVCMNAHAGLPEDPLCVLTVCLGERRFAFRLVWAVLCPACCEMETDMFRCEMPSSSSSVGTLGPPCFQKVCTGSREEAGLGVGSHTCCLCFLPPEMRAGREVQPYSAAARRFPVASSATMDCVPLNHKPK